MIVKVRPTTRRLCLVLGLVLLLAATVGPATAFAACGDDGDPGYRGADGNCITLVQFSRGGDQPWTAEIDPGFVRVTGGAPASDAILNFYRHVARREYPDAYVSLGLAWQIRQQYADFAGGYANTILARWDTQRIVGTPSDATWQIFGQVTADEWAPDGVNTWQSVYSGYYDLDNEGMGPFQELRLEDASLQLTSRTPCPCAPLRAN